MITTKVFAHRGSAGTHPENTMISFLEAEKVGADGIELDVQLSKDGEVVVIHDEQLDRTTNGKGNVKDYTLQELKSLDASYKFPQSNTSVQIPTLEEVFIMLLNNSMILNIELKNSVFLYPGLEEKVISLIKQYNLQDRIILSSFNHYSLVYCYRLAPDIETAPLYRDGLYMPWVYAKAIHAKAIHPSIKAAPNEIIKASMAAGVAVRPYTINSEEQMRMLFKINCSAIFTDYPQKAISLKNKENGSNKLE
ncbi:glycerophosphodiester phosphodiesterase [Bacillus massiliigorillae]|uniref:glycerophosphodiester phosphodiesterase n=1 Tax=Bacillus massiliigorillae TaxID=1243664 RepID=UPI000399ABB0|nr:glycerophosphodiester phosphodiesterase [Bacillus massiliigorillae]